MPCGLILNELILNALKHPFTNDSVNPEIQVIFSFDKIKNIYSLKVIDNGKGFPEKVVFNSNESMGLKLINTLTKQIDGNINMKSGHGTVIVLEFPPSSYINRF